jgi:hypothetical protein
MWFGMVVGNPSMPTMMDNSQEWKGNIAIQPWIDTCKPISPIFNLVGGFKHFLCSIIYGIILPIDLHIFQYG